MTHMTVSQALDALRDALAREQASKLLSRVEASLNGHAPAPHAHRPAQQTAAGWTPEARARAARRARRMWREKRALKATR